jgi:hypothetical protein
LELLTRKIKLKMYKKYPVLGTLPF